MICIIQNPFELWSIKSGKFNSIVGTSYLNIDSKVRRLFLFYNFAREQVDEYQKLSTELLLFHKIKTIFLYSDLSKQTNTTFVDQVISFCLSVAFCFALINVDDLRRYLQQAYDGHQVFLKSNNGTADSFALIDNLIGFNNFLASMKSTF